MLMKKSEVLLLAGGAVAWRTMEPIAYALNSLGIGFKILLYGKDESTIARSVNISLRTHLISIIEIRTIGTLFFEAVVITDNPLALPADVGMAIFSPHIKCYGVHHGPLPSEYSRSVFRMSDVYFGLYDGERFFLNEGSEASESTEFFPFGAPNTDKLQKYSSGVNLENNITLKLSGLNGKRKVLITSHWGPIGLIRMYGNSIFSAISNIHDEIHFIFSTHPKLLDGTPKDIQFNQSDVEALFRDIPQYGHTHYQGDTTELLPYVDIVVGDVSAIMAEAANFNVDIICDRRTPIPIKDLDSKFRSMAYEFSTMEQLREALIHAISHPSERSKERISFASTLFPNLGNAAKAIATKISSDMKANHLRRPM